MVRKLNKMYDASPLYAQIADDLREKIQTEVWQTGDKIPPELDLCELYNVSRITVRKAIDELVRENLLYRERAKGTFVRDWEEAEDEHFTLVRSFTNEMKELGKKAATLHAEVEVINADKKIALQLGLSVGTRCYKLSGYAVRKTWHLLYLSVLFLIIKITHLKQKIITVLFMNI